VYRAAVYVELAASDTLLVVAIDAVGGVPGGFLVGGIADLGKTGIERGMTLLPTDEGWSIPSAGVAIDASHARTWSPSLPGPARTTPTPALRRAVEAARVLAADRPSTGGLAPLLAGGDGPGDPWLGVARALIETQLEALIAGDVAAAIGPTLDLVGLGIGLTPSGDDYLVGLLASLEATGDPIHQGLASAIGEGARDRTTPIGVAMLGHATRGQFSERVHDVLTGLADGRIRAVAEPIERAMAYGATSGADTLVGLLCGLELAVARRTTRAVAAT
jgi:hypothetical protein